MKAYVFLGPTLPASDACAAADVTCLPPVAQGDVWRICQSKPDVIGIVDGYFDGVPSVWHKEILWALSQGIHVLGSASMGALRSAELADFGMEGVGAIFENYRSGHFEDDDEVAVIHGPAEAGYLPLSEPMVNIRATLEKAVAESVIDEASALALCRWAKSVHYPERSWERLLSEDKLVAASTLEALRAWLPEGHVDQKRQDALAMLARMRSLAAAPPEAKTPAFDFEWTAIWDQAVGFSTWASAGTQAWRHGVETDRVLDELRLDATRFSDAKANAMLRMLALEEADRQALSIDDGMQRRVRSAFRESRNLFSWKEMVTWREAQDLDERAFEVLLSEEERLAAIDDAVGSALDVHLLNQLRITGDYERLVDRARTKQAWLKSKGLETPTAKDLGLTPLEIRRWYFRDCLGRPAPDNIEQASRDLGFASLSDFDLALTAEYLYHQIIGDHEEI